MVYLGHCPVSERDFPLWRSPLQIPVNGDPNENVHSQPFCARVVYNNRMWVFSTCELLQAASFSFILFEGTRKYNPHI